VLGYAPVPHSTRKGWVARPECFPRNPFTSDVDSPVWTATTGERLSLRRMAGLTTRAFWGTIRAYGDPLSLKLIGAVMRGRAPSLLELPDRPPSYDDVGRLCRWDDLFPLTLLPRSRYERVLGNAVAGRRVRMDGCWHKPIGVRGWTHVVLRRERDGARRVMSLDEMLAHLDAWDRTADRRMSQRRIARAIRAIERRVLADRRAELAALEERRREPRPVADSPESEKVSPPIHDVVSRGARRGDTEVRLPQSAELAAPPPEHLARPSSPGTGRRATDAPRHAH
jgi:hypothetical protein